jgi:hypothetical protein
MGLGSEMRDPKEPIPDPGVKKAPDPGSGSAPLSILCITNSNITQFLEFYSPVNLLTEESLTP